MLTIRDAQMQAFSAALERRFVERVSAVLLECWPERFNGDGPEGAGRFVLRGMERARALEIRYECDLVRYLGLLCFLGEDFEHEILRQTELAAERRLDLVVESLERE